MLSALGWNGTFPVQRALRTWLRGSSPCPLVPELGVNQNQNDASGSCTSPARPWKALQSHRGTCDGFPGTPQTTQCPFLPVDLRGWQQTPDPASSQKTKKQANPKLPAGVTAQHLENVPSVMKMSTRLLPSHSIWKDALRNNPEVTPKGKSSVHRDVCHVFYTCNMKNL